LDKNAIRVVPEAEEVLESTSRINFAKHYTVEHNLKVKKIGMIPSDVMAWVNFYYKQAHDD
jgi:hypothetical protein